MCFSKPPKDRSAEIAREEEQKRQGRILEGRSKIDNAFSAFDPAYFENYNKAYTDVYNPQVDEQFGDARQAMRYNLARKGTNNSTPGQKAFGDLTESYGDQRRKIASDALTATNSARSDVERNKTELYSQNQAAADPSLAAISAVGRAGSLTTTPSYSPLGDLFTGLVNGAGQYAVNQSQQLPSQYRGALRAPVTSNGSGRVVN